MVVFALLAAQLAHVGNSKRHYGKRRIDIQRGQILVGESRPHVGESGKAQVGFVGAELAHGVVVGDARERCGQRDAGCGKARGEELLNYREDMFAAREAHLEIDLRELKLAIGAEILVAETAGDLEVAVEARDHEDLLEDLGRLRQCVELAWMDAAWYQEIARAFGGGLR